MSNINNKAVTLLVGVFLAISVIFVVSLLNMHNKLNDQVYKYNILLNKQSNEDIKFVKSDLTTYNSLSPLVIQNITQTMALARDKYKIPVGLMHAIFRIESDYRFWLIHPNVQYGNKTINARGLGGVVWEFWKDSLKAKGIAQYQSDLLIPEIGIMASAYILRVIINQEMKAKREGDLLSRIVTRYYGAYNQLYKDKTIIITSDLWMKRMLMDIKQIGIVDVK